MAIEKYENRFIGFFDVLGFSRMLEQHSVEELHSSYSSLIDEAKTKVFSQSAAEGSPEQHVSNFAKGQFLFDSVVLVSHSTDNYGNICKFIMASTLLMEESFQRGFFLRGCISQGDFLDDSERGIFLSPQFPQLVRGEKDQEWLGCYIEDVAENAVLDGVFGLQFLRSSTFKPMRNHPLIQYEVSMKDGTNKKRWCLNWAAMIDPPLLEPQLALLIAPKQENTKKFVEYICLLPDDSQILPPSAKPAVAVAFMKTRGGMRIKFVDENGCGVDPQGKWNFAVG